MNKESFEMTNAKNVDNEIQIQKFTETFNQAIEDYRNDKLDALFIMSKAGDKVHNTVFGSLHQIVLIIGAFLDKVAET